MKEEQCAPIVVNAWKLCMQGRTGKISEAVGEVAKELWDWSRNVLGELEKRIKKVKKELDICRRSALSQQNVNHEHLLKYKLSRLEEQKELYWRQPA